MRTRHVSHRVLPLALACLALHPGPRAQDAHQARPNLLFVMADDHAAHALSCYGSRINQTPHLDRLAREGTRFAHALVTNALCAPARAVVLTGKYGHRNGVERNEQRFDGGQPTLPKLLQTAGYQTALFGKWHLGSDPTGFDHWSILPGHGRYRDPVLIENGVRRKHAGYVTEVLTSQALQWLEQRAPERPFFVMLHHKAPHRPFEPNDAHARLYDDRELPLPETLFDDHAGQGPAAAQAEMTLARHLTRTDLKYPEPVGLTPRQLLRWRYQRYVKDYLRCVASIDDSMGQVLAWLDRTGHARDTLVVYTSDNGFFLGDHGWYDKRFMYEEALRVPLLVRGPNVVTGAVIDALVANLDLPETFLELARSPVPEDMQGQSLVPWLRGEVPASWRRSFYYRYTEYPAVHMVHAHRGVRTDRYKLIHYDQLDAWELFDLQVDPHELRSRHDDPAYAGPRAELEAELRRLQQQVGDQR